MSRHSSASRYLKTASRPAPPRPPHAALSVARGCGIAPKDFDWLEKNIPCQAACPAKTDIPAYLDAIAKGDFELAYRINLRDNVFPAVLGRVCTRPCEPACRHGWKGLGEPVAICFSKRSASDFLARRDPILLEPVFPPSGRRVAIVGAGAAGLAAAREMALWGHEVTVFERDAEPGGMMVQGIPAFRLPREIVHREIRQIALQGVSIRCGVEVGRDISFDELRNSYDVVLLAVGTMSPVLPEIPGINLPGVEHGLVFLRAANAGRRSDIGRRVVVIGGGFTAVDCARMAKRLGAESVGMYYRRTVDEMYITPGEVEEMAREGIEFSAQCAPVAVLEENGRAVGVRFVRTRPGPPGPEGRRTFEPIPGSEFDVAADLILTATGQRADRSWVPEPWIAALEAAKGRGWVDLGSGVFAAGDFSAGARSLIDAIADGRNVARAMDRFLMGRDRFREEVRIEDAEETGRTREMDFWPRNPMPCLPPDRRGIDDEVETGFDAETAKREAKRCYLCHYKYEIDNELCIYCDRCLKVKPVEGCIVKVSQMIYDEQGRITGYIPSTGSKDYNLLYIDQSQCIRCGACKDVCPVECIDLQKVSLCVTSVRG
ncbi:MAG: FAD-dependent oxidoreductase [Kiritimatiellae bacterium]|nr:FAD-dependent oxidoreductase [Kiritimatiellia bacterium]MDW8458613.1 FAD-dependent oxidoreductase [Verrucomicrobiota bacterium]